MAVHLHINRGGHNRFRQVRILHTVHGAIKIRQPGRPVKNVIVIHRRRCPPGPGRFDFPAEAVILEGGRTVQLVSVPDVDPDRLPEKVICGTRGRQQLSAGIALALRFCHGDRIENTVFGQAGIVADFGDLSPAVIGICLLADADLPAVGIIKLRFGGQPTKRVVGR
ncbi:hypothetical protein [Xenorhabdus bovienii]|uniref:hypothetical protein n=1 Tax=Xenorhabdus bovienii TaxID=40576 RepID=UPI0023B2CC6F|nr:hypothetical protein [Xenorhabdus bovienii]